jgi:hypothetical protein
VAKEVRDLGTESDDEAVREEIRRKLRAREGAAESVKRKKGGAGGDDMTRILGGLSGFPSAKRSRDLDDESRE